MPSPVAPYVISLEGETSPAYPLVVTTDGVAYRDPLHDAFARDEDGVLWKLCGGTPSGRPRYAELHTERQRTAMEHFLCAGCAAPGSRGSDGMLWILPHVAGEKADWEGVKTAIPPLCGPCGKDAPQVPGAA